MPRAPFHRILVVDDEDNVRNAIRRSLRKEGYELFFASQPSEGLTILKENQTDMVISDHMMPNMTGLEFLKIVHERHPDCMRIMLTGHADMQTAIDAINQGEIYRFLTKPWDDTELKVTIHLAFEQLELMRENRRLMTAVRRQYDLIKSLEREYPGIGKLVRDADGAISLDRDTRPSTPETH